MSDWHAGWVAAAAEPVAFVRGMLGAEPEPWQEEALKAISGHDRVAIRSGHGVGKSCLVAWAILWFMLTRVPYKIPVIANSQDQLRDVVWPEIRQWAMKLPEAIRCNLVIQSDRISLKENPEAGFAVARTASKDNPEALQGFHQDNLLFVVEEASGVPDIVFESGIGSLSTPGAKMLMVGNPTRRSGYFFDAFHGMRARWRTMRVNSEDVARATGHIEDVTARYGKDSNIYRIRVLGDFPEDEDDVLIPSELVEAATMRDVGQSPYKVVWGLDVARFGDDRSALAKRKGNMLLEPVQCWRSRDTMQTAGMVFDGWLEAAERPEEILVDVIGLGAGVVDRLRELGAPVRGVNVGESAAFSERYARRRDELWFMAREWFDRRDCRIPEDPELIRELTAVKYAYQSNGKLKVESKDDMRARGMKSPDVADAFVLTFAGGTSRIEMPDRYRKKWWKEQRTSAWAA